MRVITTVSITLAALLCLAPAQAQERIAPESWFTAADYPAAARNPLDVGTVIVNYTITPEGRATDCRVQHATVRKPIEDATCPLIVERARYIPRHDKSGKAVAGKDRLGLKWIDGKLLLPGGTDFGGAIPTSNPSSWITFQDMPRDMLKIRALDVPMDFVIGADGRISACNVPADISQPVIAQYTCRLMIRRARFEMPLGRNGESMATRGRSSFWWRVPD